MTGKKLNRSRGILAIIVIVIILGGLLVYYLSIVPKTPISPYVTEFPTKGTAYPNAIAVDDQGRVWFALWNETALGMLYPSNGTVRTFPLPEPGNSSLETWGVTVNNTDGLVWFTDYISNAIWSFNMTSHAFAKHLIPTNGSFPFQVALDQKGNVWFDESFAGKLGELTTQGVMKEYAIPGNGTNRDPTGLAMSNGTLWFTEPLENVIGSFYNGEFTMYNMTGLIDSPLGIVMDSQGNLWVTQHTYPGLIGEFNPVTHFVKTFATSYLPEFQTSLPYFIYTDSHGNIWFNEHYGNGIGIFNPSTNSLVEYHVPLSFAIPGNLTGILTMTLSQSGQPWFTELFTGNVGTINSTAPIKQKITIANPAQVISIAKGSSSSLSLSIQDSVGGELSAYLGNFTNSFSFAFSPGGGSGNFSSTLTIQNNGAKTGVYFVTISDATRFLTVSQVVEVRAP